MVNKMIQKVVKKIGLLTLILVMVSCDDTQDFYLKSNETPKISFTFSESGTSILIDSVKISKRGTAYKGKYDVSLTVSDKEDNLDKVYYTLVSGNGWATSGDYLTKGELSKNGSGIYGISYHPGGLGYHEVLFVAVDNMTESDSVKLILRAFENLPPVATLDVRSLRVVGRYEYSLDSEESYDTDSKYGGGIVEYEFNINSTLINTQQPKINYVFGSKQIARIGVRVKDNDGVWSKRTEGIYNID